LVKQLVKGFNIPILELDGYEADDVIGTIAKQMARKDFEVFMMTPDKDYGQLVEEHVYLYKPAFMGNAVEVMGIPEILKKWNIARIDQVIDMLGLQGDSVDNIPGIPGIGPKTAAKLLEEYDTVEGILANADKLKGKQKEKVIENADQARLSKELATIDIEVPIKYTEKDLVYEGFNKDLLTELFDELEFRTIAKRIFGEEEKKGKAKKSNSAQMSLFDKAEEKKEAIPSVLKDISKVAHDYHLVTDEAAMKDLANFLNKQDEFCFDTETTNLDPFEAELVGISFCYYPGEAYYIPVPDDAKKAKEIVEIFRVPFENESILKIAQNVKYDRIVLENYGLSVKGKIFDTMLAHYLIEPDMRHNMNILAETYLHYQPVSIETLIGKKGKKQLNMRDADPVLVAEYAGEDADVTLQLKKVLAPLLSDEKIKKLFEEVECPLVEVLADIERNGVKVDTEALKNFSKELQIEITALEKSVYEIAGEEFNIGSPKQLGEILFDKLKLVEKPKKTKSGQYATGEEILVTLAPEHEVVRQILDFRQMQKLKSTYVDALPTLISPKDDLIHTSYNQAVAATGRLSSTNPNLQNIPIRTARGREIRKAFVSRGEDYKILAADYSQIELRIMAAFSEDETMIKAFKNGEDIHATTASKLYKVPIEEVDGEMRRRAKTANFGIIYGISAFGLSQRLNIPRKEASEIIENYFDEFSSIKKYMDEVINFAREHEYVETILGRKRYLRDINSRNYTLRGFAERNAVNAPIQGSAADMIKVAMIQINNWLKAEKLQSKMIMQVHDELVFDAHVSEIDLLKEKIPQMMKEAVQLSVPMEVETGIGDNWLEAH
jgi:DNA polymerase-1